MCQNANFCPKNQVDSKIIQKANLNFSAKIDYFWRKKSQIFGFFAFKLIKNESFLMFKMQKKSTFLGMKLQIFETFNGLKFGCILEF